MDLGRGHRLTLDEGLAQIPSPEGERLATLFTHGSLDVELYAPHEIDPQQPHTRDEVYVVARGSGMFTCDGDLAPCQPGDFLFVPAGIEHHFEDFTDDFAVWVLFYGPEGGEAASATESS